MLILLSLLQETKALLFSAYTVFLFALFGIPLLFLIGDKLLRVLLMSLFINIPVAVTVACLCGPKFLKVMGIQVGKETSAAIKQLQSTYGKSTTSKITPQSTQQTSETGASDSK